MCDLVRRFAAFVVLSALLTQPSYAQQLPESPRQKAEEAGKKAYLLDSKPLRVLRKRNNSTRERAN
jgi:hypothetical protein